MAKTSTIFDTFAAQDTALWDGWSADVDILDDQLFITYLNSGPFLQTDVDYDLTASAVFVEVFHTASFSDETYFAFGDAGSPVFGGNQMVMVVNTTTLFLRELVAGVASDTTVSYDDTTMRWWRIRHAGTTVFWETSPDGLDWTTQRSKTAGFTPSAGRVKLCGFNPVADQMSSPARFDNLNGGVPATVEGVITATVPSATAAFTADATVTGVVTGVVPSATASFSGAVQRPIIVGEVSGPAVTPRAAAGPALNPDPAAAGPEVARHIAGAAVSRAIDGVGV